MSEPTFILTEVAPSKPVQKQDDPNWVALYCAVCRMLETVGPRLRQIKQASTKIGPYKVVGKRFKLHLLHGSTVTSIEFHDASETIGDVVDRLMKHPAVQIALSIRSDSAEPRVDPAHPILAAIIAIPRRPGTSREASAWNDAIVQCYTAVEAILKASN